MKWPFETPELRLMLDALVATLGADRQLLAALAAACTQDIASIGSRHALAETVLVAALPYGGLKSPFHLRANCSPEILSPKGTAKIGDALRTPNKTCDFSTWGVCLA